MKRSLVAALVLLPLIAVTANALRIEGETIILPVVGRFPGDGGTQWRTDLFILNPYADLTTVTLKFYDAAGPHAHTHVLPGYGSLTFPDVVLTTFGLANGGGPLEIETNGRIEARARIYNTGNPAGQFGQSVQGIGKDRLGRQSSVFGLSANGTRVNVGAMNPNDHAVTVTMVIQDRYNMPLASQTFDLPPHSYRQFSNIFPAFGIPPQDTVRVQFNEIDDPIYGYASEVRNDTGDAVFTFGTAPNTGP
jgi:hypothetical protein